MTQGMGEKFVTDSDLEAMRIVKRQTLAKWRMQGRGPKYFKLPGGAIRYRMSDVENWISAAAVDPQEKFQRAG